MNKTLPILIASAFAAGAFAQGQPNPATPATPVPGGAASFESLDKNADQKISKAEAGADRSLNASFTTLDADKDGALTMAEYAKHVPMR